MRNLEPRRRRWIRVRIAILGTVLLTFAGFVIRRAYEVQVERGVGLREMAEEQYLRQIQLAPKRGTIFDRHGAELAVSVDADSVWANPRVLAAADVDPRMATTRIATVLEIDEARIATRLSSDRYFVWIDRHVTPQQALAVRALDLPGVHITTEARRYYPNRELAAHVLGFANIDGTGIEGIELSMEERLRGADATVEAIRDRRGTTVFSRHLFDDRASQGDDLVLTIDKTLQLIAERELSLGVRTFEARAGSVVVVDPRTAEILAMANYPTFNPNEPGLAPVAHRRNRALTDRFEPGSTIKPFTIAGALAAGRVGSQQLIDCEAGAMEVAEFTIHDSHRFERLTPAQILAFSSNIGTAKIGATLGRSGLFRVFRQFGFGEVSGVPLPGETQGILRHYSRWYEMDTATISFGQGMSVNALQLTMAMAALANGGRLMRPVLVRRVVDGAGATIEETLPEVRRQVVPRATARLVADMLTAVTGPDGTGTEAAIEGHLVAGKTGTAQKADYVHGGYADDRWVASFVGFVPAEQPRLVIAVIIDEPLIAHYGGTVAGPIFRRVGAQALRHLGVPATAGVEAVALRDLVPSNANDGGVRHPAVVVAATGGDAPLVVLGENLVAVPDLANQTARGALVAARVAGLSPVIEGSGVVASQWPGAGAAVPRGTEIRLLLSPPDHVERHDPWPTASAEGAVAAVDGVAAGSPSGLPGIHPNRPQVDDARPSSATHPSSPGAP